MSHGALPSWCSPFSFTHYHKKAHYRSKELRGGITMFKIDALGKACPLPVIEAHKALKDHDAIEITVDNEIATENLKNLSEQMNCAYTMTKESDTHYTVTLVKEGAVVSKEAPAVSGSDYIVVLNAPVMGLGDDTLGKNLLKTFIYTLTEQDVLPKQIICYNGGVSLVTEDSESLEDLKHLEEKGVEVYACGACLNYYGLTDKVAVGSITNMFRIVEMMRTANRIVKP